VHLMVSNNVLTRVDIDDHWLDKTADSIIEKELSDVLRFAFPGISRQTRQTATAIPAVSTVLAAANQPADLLRQLGLTSQQEANDVATNR
jgi:hypothetical protein